MYPTNNKVNTGKEQAISQSVRGALKLQDIKTQDRKMMGNVDNIFTKPQICSINHRPSCLIMMFISFFNALSQRSLGRLSPNFATCSEVTRIYKLASEIWSTPPQKNKEKLWRPMFQNCGVISNNFTI